MSPMRYQAFGMTEGTCKNVLFHDKIVKFEKMQVVLLFIDSFSNFYPYVMKHFFKFADFFVIRYSLLVIRYWLFSNRYSTAKQRLTNNQ